MFAIRHAAALIAAVLVLSGSIAHAQQIWVPQPAPPAPKSSPAPDARPMPSAPAVQVPPAGVPVYGDAGTCRSDPIVVDGPDILRIRIPQGCGWIEGKIWGSGAGAGHPSFLARGGPGGGGEYLFLRHIVRAGEELVLNAGCGGGLMQGGGETFLAIAGRIVATAGSGGSGGAAGTATDGGPGGAAGGNDVLPPSPASLSAEAPATPGNIGESGGNAAGPLGGQGGAASRGNNPGRGGYPNPAGEFDAGEAGERGAGFCGGRGGEPWRIARVFASIDDNPGFSGLRSQGRPPLDRLAFNVAPLGNGGPGGSGLAGGGGGSAGLIACEAIRDGDSECRVGGGGGGGGGSSFVDISAAARHGSRGRGRLPGGMRDPDWNGYAGIGGEPSSPVSSQRVVIGGRSFTLGSRVATASSEEFILRVLAMTQYGVLQMPLWIEDPDPRWLGSPGRIVVRFLPEGARS